MKLREQSPHEFFAKIHKIIPSDTAVLIESPQPPAVRKVPGKPGITAATHNAKYQAREPNPPMHDTGTAPPRTTSLMYPAMQTLGHRKGDNRL